MSEPNNEKNIEPTEAAEQPTTQNVEQRKIEKKAKKEERKKKMYRRITVILLIVIVILILLLLQKCSSDVPVLNPDFPPQETEENAEPIPGGSGDKLDHIEGGGAVILDFNDELIIDLSDKVARLNFANPGQSTQDMMLQIVIQDIVVAQSGRILPGYEISRLDLLPDVDKMLSEGTYKGKFVINYYDPETNERAMVNSEASVTIQVYP